LLNKVAHYAIFMIFTHIDGTYFVGFVGCLFVVIVVVFVVVVVAVVVVVVDIFSCRCRCCSPAPVVAAVFIKESGTELGLVSGRRGRAHRGTRSGRFGRRQSRQAYAAVSQLSPVKLTPLQSQAQLLAATVPVGTPLFWQALPSAPTEHSVAVWQFVPS